MTRRIAVFQHIESEHPWMLRDFLDTDGIGWDAIELNRGEPIPELSNYDGLWVMGGPMDVWEENEYPWLREEKAAIRRAVVDLKLPFLGLCLGHQLLAEALGGRVEPSKVPEIGVLDVHITPDGREHELLAGIADTFKCLQWHSAEVVLVPREVSVLASTNACKIQAMATAHSALSLQFHVEIASDTVSEWGEIPAYKNALERSLGEGALAHLKAQTDMHMQGFNACARTLYNNWRRLAFGL